MNAAVSRTARLARKTRETQISVELGLDGEGVYAIETGIPFMNHMLELLAKHACLDLRVEATGDLEVDDHHLVEDLGLVLGDALSQALGDRAGIARYGFFMLPMDETLSCVALDLGGRPFLVYQADPPVRKIHNFDLGLIEEFMRAFATQARMNLHVQHIYGREPHHIIEGVFKALARALRMAIAPDPRMRGVPSSKGVL
jgi:imidazoleglycerol-phosphate dehydratase